MAANYSDEEEDDIIHIGEIQRQKLERVRYKDRKIERVEEEMTANYSDEEEDDIIHIGAILRYVENIKI